MRTSERTIPSQAVKGNIPIVAGSARVFGNELKNLYWLENHMQVLLPMLQETASSEELSEMLLDRIEVASAHAKKCVEIFRTIEMKPEPRKSQGIEKTLIEAGSVKNIPERNKEMDERIVSWLDQVDRYSLLICSRLFGLSRSLANPLVTSLVAELLQEKEEGHKILSALGPEPDEDD